MAVTTGLVHALYTSGASATVEACVFIGPTPTYVTILAVRRQPSAPPHVDATTVSLVDALAQALASNYEVIVRHADTDAFIHSVELR